MTVYSAGILAYKFDNSELKVLLSHPGGPFWYSKDLRCWSIPKGLQKSDENMLQTAIREFQEETGFNLIGYQGKYINIGELKQPSGKIVVAYAIESDFDVSKFHSNFFTLGDKEYPETDRGEWFSITDAKQKILKGQLGFLDTLVERL